MTEEQRLKALNIMRNQSRINLRQNISNGVAYAATGGTSTDVFDFPQDVPTSNVDVAKQMVKRQQLAKTLPEEHSWWDGAVQGATKMMNDVLRMSTTAKAEKLQNNTFEQQALEHIEQWNQLQTQKKELMSEIQRLEDNGIQVPEKHQQLDAINAQIDQLDNYFLTEGKRLDSVVDLMFDRNQSELGTRLDAWHQYITGSPKEQIANSWNKAVQSHGNQSYVYTPGGSPSSTLEDLEFFGSTITSGLEFLGRSLWGSGRALFGDKKELIKDAIKSVNNKDNELLNKTYRGNDPIVNRKTNNAVNPIDQSAIDTKREELKVKAKQLEQDYLESDYYDKLGDVRMGGVHLWNYDPKVADWWEKEDNKFGEHWYDFVTMPSHTLGATGSTVGMWWRQALLMGFEGTTLWALKELGSAAVLGESKLAQGAFNVLDKGAKAGMLGTGLYATVKSREDETAAEMMEAYPQRVMDTAFKNGADVEKVVTEIDRQLAERVPVEHRQSVLDKSLDERLKLGIAYGIKTGDEAWDDALLSSQAGLTKLVNQNNALAFADYIEMLPYLPYTGSLISNTIKKNLFESAAIRSHAAHALAHGRSAEVSGKAMERLWNSRKVQDRFASSLLYPGGYVSNKIDKAAEYLMSKGHTKLGLYGSDVLKYASKRIPLGLATSWKEGIEEGQQHLLQQRYGRGEYDNYYDTPKMFDLDEAVEVAGLGLEAVAGFFGVNYGDIDNGDIQLQKAMNIGFASSLLFNNAVHFGTNAFGANGTNARSLVNDLKASKTIYKLMSDSYERDQDYQHANIFLQSMRRGRTANQLKDKLQMMFDGREDKNNSAITQDMIDADKLLIDNVQYMMNNLSLIHAVQNHGGKKFDEDHMSKILDGAVRITDVDKTNELLRTNRLDINRTQNLLHNLLEQLLDDNVSKEEKDAILSEFPVLEKLFNNFNQLYDTAVKNNKLKSKGARLALADLLTKVRKGTLQPVDAERTLRAQGLEQEDIDDILEQAFDKTNNANDLAENLYRTIQKRALLKSVDDTMSEGLESIQQMDKESSTDFEKRKSDSKKQSFVGQSTLRNYIRRKVLSEKKLFTQKDIEEEVTKRLEDIYDNQGGLDEFYNNVTDDIISPIDKTSFFRNKLNEYHVYKQTQAIEKALSIAKNQSELLKFVRRMTGLDINTNTLGGIIDELEHIQKQNKKKLAGFYKNPADNVFESDAYDWTSDDNNTQEYERLLTTYFMNGGLLGPQTKIAQAYMFGKVRPQEMRNAIYGRNYEGDTEFDPFLDRMSRDENVTQAIRDILNSVKIGDTSTTDAERQLDKLGVNENDIEMALRRAFDAKANLDNLANRISPIVEHKDASKRKQENKLKQKDASEAAWEFINNRTKEQQERARVARRRKIEEAEDEIAEPQLQQEQQPQQDDQQQQSKPEPTRRPMSAGERELREKHLHEDSKKKERLEREKEKHRKNKESGEENEPGADGVPDPLDDEPVVLTSGEGASASATIPATPGAPAVVDGESASAPVAPTPDEPLNPVSTTPPVTPVAENTDAEAEHPAPTEPESDDELDETPLELPEPEEENAEQDDMEDTSNDELTDILDKAQLDAKAAEKQTDTDIDVEMKKSDDDINDTLETGFVQIDDFNDLYVDEDGNVCYGDQKLNSEQAAYILDELRLLGQIEVGSIDLNAIPMSSMDDKVNEANVTDEFIGDYLSSTFFYAIDERKTESLADEGTEDLFNGVKLPKKIGTAERLSLKLSTKGWLASTKQYYIVTAQKKAYNVTNPEHFTDALTVNMIIEDNEECYICFLRDLGVTNTDGVVRNNELYWRNWLQLKNVNVNKIERELGKTLPTDKTQRANAVARFLKDKIKQLAKQLYLVQTNNDETGFEKWYANEGVVRNDKNQQMARNAMLGQIRTIVLRSYALSASRALDDRDIDETIDKLRAFRNSIINEYCTIVREGDNNTYYFKDSEGKILTDNVVPVNARQSNGCINNVKDAHKQPVLHTIQSINESLESITEHIANNQMVFGMGRGPLSEERFKIVPLLAHQSKVSFNGKGLGGKLYMFVESPVTGNRVPIMLTEEKFNYQYRERDGKVEKRYGVRSVLELQPDGTFTTKESSDGYTYHPSAAEVLFYMLTDKINLGVNTEAQKEEIVEFFIHSGKKTIFANNNKYGNHISENSSLFHTYTSKQLNYENGVLTIAIKDPATGNFIAREFTQDMLFKGEQAEANREMCIQAIANQMHWNTDKDHINSNIVANATSINPMSMFVKYLIDTQAKPLIECNDVTEYLNQEVSILGCEQLTFKLSDFFEENSSRTDVQAKDVNTMAWMLKNGKILTDLGDPAFVDPFVFASGVVNKGKLTEKPAPTVEPEAAPVGTTTSMFQDETKAHNFDDITIADGFPIATSEAQRQINLEELNANTSKGEILDLILLDLPNTDDVYNDTINKVTEFLNTYEKQYGLTFANKDAVEKQVEKILKRWGNQIEDGSAILGVKIQNKNGDTTFTLNPTPKETDKPAIYTGVYSTKKGKNRRGGILSSEARRWLFKTLGISNYNVIVRNAILKGAQNEDVFGVTELVADSITGKIAARFNLANVDGSRGVHYHEAWHYVNLLLHNKEQRRALYDEYYKYHKTHSSDKEIEEDMAEDFLEFMEGYLDDTLPGKIRRAFHNMIDFFNVLLNRKRYRQIYKKIADGGYQNSEMLEQSIADFCAQYGASVNQIAHPVSGYNNEVLSKLPHIDSYHDLYEAADSVVNNALLHEEIDSIDKAYDLVRGDGFKKIASYIDQMIDTRWENDEWSDADDVFEMLDDDDDVSDDDKEIIRVLLDLRDNHDTLRESITRRFAILGFTADFKKIKKPKEDVTSQPDPSQIGNDAELKTDDADNVWDRLELTMSRKDSAGVRVKMFLATIPKYTNFLNKKGVLKTTPHYDRFGTQLLWEFDRVWSALSEDLASVKSYGEMKGEDYAPDSLRGVVKRLAKSNALYRSIDIKLTRLDLNPKMSQQEKTALLSQLFNIFNAHRNHIQTIDLVNPYEAEVFDLDSADVYETKAAFTSVVADVNKTWLFSDDGMYNPAWVIPRRWSQALASNGLSAYNSESGVTISKEFVTLLSGVMKQMLDHINNVTKEIKTDVKNNPEAIYKKHVYGDKNTQGLIDQLTHIYNILGIPIDGAVLSIFISKKSEIIGDADLTGEQIYNTLKDIITSKKRGALQYFVNKLADNVGQSSMKVTDENGRSKEVAIDEVFNNYGLDSDIAKLALSYAAVYPSLKELSTKSANGDTLYPVNLNNYLSDVVNDANQRGKQWANRVQSSPYCGHSIIAEFAKQVRDYDEETKLRLNTFVGMKQIGTVKGSDYLEITPLEDYLTKMMMIENNNLIFPTMADKKTWYSLSVGSSAKATKEKIGDNHAFNLEHTPMVYEIPTYIRQRVLRRYYQQYVELYDESIHGTLLEFTKNFVTPWYEDLKLSRVDAQSDAAYKAFVNQIEQDIHNEFELAHPGMYRRFGKGTLNRFAGYFIDELNSLIKYYSAEHIESITKDATLRIANFHGEFDKNGKMLFGGNGGLFRYFYDVEIDTENTFVTDGGNLNQKLQALWLLQQHLMDKEVKNEATDDDDVPNTKLGRQFDKNSDGFELIRQYLNELKLAVYLGADNYRPELLDAVNDKLVQMTIAEMERLSDPNSPLYLIKKLYGQYLPNGIPVLFLEPYIELLLKLGCADTNPIYAKASASNSGNSAAVFSLIGSYVANGATSIIEVEKIFSGDPAFYKYKGVKGEKKTVTITYTQNGEVVSKTVQTDVLGDIFGDKIKRLGGTLSPGTELRLDFSQAEIEDDIRIVTQHFKEQLEKIQGQAILGGSKYTVLDVEDIKAQSEVLDIIKFEFTKQTVIDLIRCGKLKVSGDLNTLITNMYYDKHVFDEFYDSYKDQSINGIPLLKYVEDEVDAMAGPYAKITVADAQVLIRPAMYRKIRKALGDWSLEDEEAYWIIETDDSWMTNRAKAKKVHKFQQYALKMSYFANDVKLLSTTHNINMPLYNKMAIFPLFKFLRSTNTGRQVYDRMNMAGHELDMIAFKSAVKVGAVQNGLQLIDSNADSHEKVSRLSSLLNKPSSVHLNYQTDTEFDPTEEEQKNGVLSVKVQDLHNIRMQLNTHAHEDDIRSIGTQMFKIAFENILDDEIYGVSKVYSPDGKYEDSEGKFNLDGNRARKGVDIKKDIMRLISSLTKAGVLSMYRKFYDVDDEGHSVLNETKVREYIRKVVENNGLGAMAEDIMGSEDGVVASLMSRQVFEQSVSKLVNEEVVNINTQGGTAIQQSVFGFEQYGNGFVSTQDGDNYVKYNNGQNLKWNVENGSMEVILSIKFFKSVVPEKYSHSFEDMRQWLIDNDIIKGYKTSGYTELTEAEVKINETLAKSLDELELTDELKQILTNGKCKTIKDVIKNSPKLFYDQHNKDVKFSHKKASQLVEEALAKVGLTSKSHTIHPKAIVGTETSKPNPFGIGYRIPTQGMSSMFTFTVADVLPSNVGDLIIVPREFTAQTGSDFDVDKLYLATLSYNKDGVLERESQHDDAIKAYTNELLLNYMDLISDPRNFGQSRGSIDVFTSFITYGLLPKLRDTTNDYTPGMYSLMPSFQAFRKMEFSTGKFGIGPFALNVTNLALTQYTHLTLDFDKIKEFKLLPFDSIYGKDGRLISGWLSAMVNAHVDVAKDPYIFALNVNKCTYNTANFLIRTGNGLATFAFLAQPILKLYAQNINNGKGIYGKNFFGDEEKVNKGIAKTLSKQYLAFLKKALIKLRQVNLDVLNDEDYETIKAKIEQLETLYAFYDNKFYGKKEDEKPKSPKIDWSDVIGLTKNEESLLNLKNGTKAGTSLLNAVNITTANDIKSLTDLALHYSHQLLVMLAFLTFEPYAKAMSTLVTCSQIDTKKFGNDITQHRLFINRYRHNRYNHSGVNWIINTDEFKNTMPTKEQNGKIVTDYMAASDKALDVYFESMFLDEKLTQATNLTREILKSQSVVATDGYDLVFREIMSTVYGRITFEDHSKDDEHKLVAEGFGQVFNADRATAISSSVEIATRYNIFMAYGPQIYRDEIASNPNTKMIDFTLNGNRNMVVAKMNELYFGANDKQSIFERLASMISDMKINPFAKLENGQFKYKGLVSGRTGAGEVRNDLLRYLNPVLPSNKYPIGRMMLAESQMNVPGDIKRRYTTAFTELLYHSNPEIQELAKDLVFFAYYSSYDLNTPGSFFDLVPLEFRRQYDKALSIGVAELNNSQTQDQAVCNMLGTSSLNTGITNVMDVIARNFWYNDDLVPTYNYHDDEYDAINNPVNILNNKTGETVIGSHFDSEAQWSFPGVMITNKNENILQDKRYIKLQHNGVSYVYKRVGQILRHTKKEGEDGNPYMVYMVIPKAGSKQKGVKQYEMYANYAEDSIFGENRLPDTFAEDVLREKIETRVNNYNSVEQQPYTCELVWNDDTIPLTRIHTNPSAYKSVTESVFDTKATIHNTTISIIDGESVTAEYIGQKRADMIINIVNSDNNNKNIAKDDFKDKTLQLILGKPLDIDLFTALYDKLRNSDANESVADSQPGFVIHITTNLSDYGVFKSTQANQTSAFEQRVAEAIQKKVDEYIQKLVEDTDDKEIKISAFRTTLMDDEYEMSKIRKSVVSQMTYEYVEQLLSGMTSSGANIRSITTSAKKDGTLMSRSVSYAFSMLGKAKIENGSTSYVHRSWTGSRDAGKYYQYFKNDLKRIYENGKNSAEVEAEALAEQEVKVEQETKELKVPVLEAPVESTIEQPVQIVTEAQKANDEDMENKQCQSGISGALDFDLDDFD